jgi:hypothetical protein
MWMACPASVTMTRDAVRPSSKYAKEGTAAHAVAEMILKGDIFLPDRVTVEGDEFIVSPGMCRALNPYIDYVQGLRARWASTVYLEKRLIVPGTFNRVWGTLDCGVYDRLLEKLFVVDLKFGKGVAVEPDSPQLKLYALALAGHVRQISDLDGSVSVVLTICQPRIGGDPLRSHMTTLGALWDWCEATVRPAVTKIKNGDTSEVAGAHCRWCVRKTECKAFANKHQAHAAAAFDDIP